MAPVLIASLVIVGSATLIVLLFRFLRQQSEQTQRNVAALAAQLGLTLAPPRKIFGLLQPPEAAGRHRGRETRLFYYTTGSGKSRTSWCALGVKPQAAGGLTFSIARQGLDTKVAEFFGAREITVGDPVFDQAWFIRTNQPDFLRAALLPELRSRLTSALADSGHAYRWGNLRLESDTILYSEIGDFSSEPRCARFARMADVLSDLAAVAEVFAAHAPSNT